MSIANGNNTHERPRALKIPAKTGVIKNINKINNKTREKEENKENMKVIVTCPHPTAAEH